MSRFLNELYRSITPYTPGLQPTRTDIVKLNTNESPYPPSPRVAAAIDRALIEKLRRYNDIQATELCDSIAKRHGVNRSEVFVGNGSDEVLALAMLAFAGDGAAFADITYGFYPVWANLFRIRTQQIPLTSEYEIDPADYQSDDKMIILANPNAPTGIALPLSRIRQILEANPSHVVLVDEAYVEFGAESAVPLIGEYDNLLVVKTFSKSHSLAGARLGYAIGQEALIEDLNRIKFSFHPYNVNSLSNVAGAAAMDDEEYYRVCREQIMATREWTTEALEALGFCVLPSKANFVFARHAGLSSLEYVNRLYARGILIRRFSQPRIEDFTRITIGTREQMGIFIEATLAILSSK